jgi:hypothetical protein
MLPGSHRPYRRKDDRGPRLARRFAAGRAAGAIPFNPPVGRPLRYRLTRTIAKQDGTVTARLDYEIGFSRQSKAFRMSVRAANFDVFPGPPEVGAVVGPLIMELLEHFSVRRDGEGHRLLVEDGTPMSIGCSQLRAPGATTQAETRLLERIEWRPALKV